MKRIIFLTTDSKPMRGGVAEYLHQLCESLGRKQLSVEMRSTVPDCLKWHPKDYQMHRLPSRPSRNLGRRLGDGFSLTRKFNTFCYYQSLRKLAVSEIQSLLPIKDGVVIIGYWSPESHFWCRACAHFQIPYVIIFQGLDLIRQFDRRIDQWRKVDIRRAAHLVVSSSPTGELLKKIADESVAIAVLHPIVGDNHHGELSESTLHEQRDRLGISEAARVLLGVGRLIKRKGFDLVLESLADLKKDGLDLFFVLAGDGPEKKNLLDQAKRLGVLDRLILRTDVLDDEKNILYALCDIFVMPNRTLGGSDWEGFGIVFLEAGLAGKPSIAGNNGGVVDAVVNGQTGLLVETEDHRETTEAIRNLVLNDALRRQMGDAAKERVKTFFSGKTKADMFFENIQS